MLDSGDVIIDENKRLEIEKEIKDKGMTFEGGEMGGWTGGQVWLVPLDKSIEEWKPIAVSELI